MHESLLSWITFLPLAVGRQKTIALIKDAVRDEQVIGVVTQRKAEEEDPGAADLYTVGTVARVVKLLKMGEDNYSLVVQGLARFRVLDLVQESPYLKARVDPVEDKSVTDDVEVEALAINLKKLAREVIELMPELPAAATELVESITHPGHLADLIAANVDVPIEEKQQVLETVELKPRMKLVLELLNRKREILKLSSKIDSAVKGEMSKTQREYYLRQQLKAIKEELGELGEEEEELDELQERLKKAGLPPEVEKVAQKELNRLKSIPTASSEYTVARTYLDWIADLPWSKRSDDNLDIENAKGILDADHYGLDKIKKRILEYLAVRKLKNDMRGPILCFVGPPGVGKTSLGQSIARATGRKFVRLSLGGVRDEAEIRGHRRTYVGALPGRIIQSMKKAGTVNPVMMLDEVDKLGADFRGDPSAALLEVLDPEQNHAFSDHYLDLAYEEWEKKGLLTSWDGLREAILHGAVKRVRPKVMTVACMFMGLLPIMWSTGAGADVMKRIAAPMIGGIFTSFIMELVVYPAIYAIWKWHFEVKPSLRPAVVEK